MSLAARSYSKASGSSTRSAEAFQQSQVPHLCYMYHYLVVEIAMLSPGIVVCEGADEPNSTLRLDWLVSA